MNPIWLLRMARWVRHPPSRRTMAIWAVAGLVCLAVVGFEWAFGWPDWLTVNRPARPFKP